MVRFALIGVALAAWVTPAAAKPPAPGVVCEVWPQAKICQDGQPNCDLCHTAPPPRNVFGQAVEAALLPGEARPIDDETFAAALPAALAEVADDDVDGDGASNYDELLAGTNPADPEDTPEPMARGCDGPLANPDWDVCGYDAVYVFKKVHLDVCGASPDFADLETFRALAANEQPARIDEALRSCLRTAFWVGADGVLDELAHAKIRPLRAIKSGARGGPVPLADYDHDYALFAYTQSGDRDAREVLTADYYVLREGLEFRELNALNQEEVVPERRAGMLTTLWNFTINTMFTALPRTTAAQAYRAYLGLDIARSEGLIPVDGEPVDYDDSGVQAPTCAGCHSTLDPLSYPFALYHGIDGRRGQYNPQRMRGFARDIPSLGDMPEAGVLLGEPVADLVEWAEVAADSEAFARATVRDYWRIFLGHLPRPNERAEYEQLWQDFMTTHDYRVERMLSALVRTEAYGVP